jgi:hypothetical protein
MPVLEPEPKDILASLRAGMAAAEAAWKEGLKWDDPNKPFERAGRRKRRRLL